MPVCTKGAFRVTQSSSLAVLVIEEQPATPFGMRGVRSAIVDVVSSPMAREGALSLADQAISSATNFATSVIVARLASREELGLYVLAMSIVFLVRLLQEQIVGTPYRVYCHRHHGNSLAAYTGSVLVHQAALSAAAMLGLLIALVLLPRTFLSADSARALWALLGAMPFLLARDCIRQVAFSQLKVTVAIVLDLAVGVLQIGALLTLGCLHLLSVTTAYGVLGAVCALAVAGWFVFQHKTLIFRRDRIASDWRRNWALARWAMAALLVGSVAPYIGPWLLAAWHSKADVGTLAACASLVGISQMFLMGISNWLSPRAAKAFSTGGVPALRRVLLLTAVVYAMVVGGFCLVFIATGNWLVVLVYGSHYAGCGNVVSVMALVIVAQALGNVAANGLWAMEQSQAHLVADSAMLLVTLGVAAMAIGPMGVLGAALATLAGATAGALVRTASLLRQMRRLGEARGVLS